MQKVHAAEQQCAEISKNILGIEYSLCFSPGFIRPLGRIKIVLLYFLLPNLIPFPKQCTGINKWFESGSSLCSEEGTHDPPQASGRAGSASPGAAGLDLAWIFLLPFCWTPILTPFTKQLEPRALGRSLAAKSGVAWGESQESCIRHV